MASDVQVLAGADVRTFVQEDGINPSASYIYYGYLMLDSPNQDLGTPDPLYGASSSQRGKFDIIGSITKAQSLGSVDFTMHASRTMSEIWFDLKDRGCKFNLQAVLGSCERADMFDKWSSKIFFKNVRLSNLGLTGLNPQSGDDNAPVDYTGTLSFEDWSIIRPIKFGEKADSTIVAEVLDGLFYDTAQCGECGLPSDGCNVIYLLTTASGGSPGLSSQLVYSKDGGQTWGTIDINTLAGLSGNRVSAMGSYVIVISQANGAYHYSSVINVNAGVQNWTRVASGFVSTKGPRAIHVKSSNQAFIAGAGGYIYYLSGPTVTPVVLTDGSVSTQDLNDIHGFGDTVIAVGGNNAILWSENDGSTFSLVTGPVVGANLTAVWVFNRTAWLVGTGTGTLWYTLDSGSTWTQITLEAGISVINDIHFEDNTVGYIAVEKAGAGAVYRTTDSGNSWQNTTPHLSSLPTSVRVNFVAPCGINRVLTGGRKTVGGDGMAAIAE